MEKCLVTRLDVVVPNEQLDKFGILSLCFANDSNFRLDIKLDEDFDITLKDAVFSDSETNSKHLSANVNHQIRISDIIVSGDTFFVEIPKYKSYLNILLDKVILNLNDFKYTYIQPGIFVTGNISGNLIEAVNNNVFGSNTIELNVINRSLSDKLTGDVEGLFDDNLIYSYFDLSGNTGLTGSLDKLGSHLTLNSINRVTLPDTKQVSLNIENFVTYARTVLSERTSELTFRHVDTCYVTFNDTEQTGFNGTLTWTSDTITFNGVTINA